MATKKDLLVGHLALEREYITEAQLSDALKTQSNLFEAGVQQGLAQVLVSNGHVTAVQAEKLEEAVASRLKPDAAGGVVRKARRGAPVELKGAQPRKGTRPRPAVRARSPTAARARVRGEPEYAQPEKSGRGVMIGIVAGAALLMIGVIAFFTWEGEEPRDAADGSLPQPAAPVRGAPATRPATAPVPWEEILDVPKSPKDLVPPGDAAKNVLPNGSLDQVRGGWFKHWRVKNGGVRVTVERKTSNAWCEIPEGGGYLEQKLVLDPAWAELRVSAVMKCKGLEFGEGPNDTFRVGLHFEDAEGNVVGKPDKVPELIEDADWVDVWAEVPVPGDRNPKYLVLRAGNFGAAGVCGIDEIRVIPQKIVKPAAAPSKRPAPTATADRLLDRLLDEEPAARAPPARAPVNDASQLAWWKFDEGGGTIAGDSSGRERNAMVLGAKWTSGRQGRALRFDGAHAYVEVPGADGAEQKSYTLCAWIRPEAGQREENGVIVGKGRTRLVYSRNSTASLFHVVERAGGDEPVKVACKGELPPGRWYYLAAVVDAEAATATLYVDGSEAGSRGWGDPELRGRAMKEHWTVGMRLGEREPFKGVIDEVRIYERPLAGGEVRALYKLGKLGESAGAGAGATVGRPLPAAGGTVGRDARLGEFLALVMKNCYDAAEELAKSAAADPGLAEHAAEFRAAAGVARALEKRRIHIQGKMRVMAGMTVELQTTGGPQEGKIGGADAEGVHLGKDIVINRQVVGQTAVIVPWSDLTPEQMKKLSTDWKPEDQDGHTALAILAAAGEEKDMDAIADALEGAGDHPLVDWVIRLTED